MKIIFILTSINWSIFPITERTILKYYQAAVTPLFSVEGVTVGTRLG